MKIVGASSVHVGLEGTGHDPVSAEMAQFFFCPRIHDAFGEILEVYLRHDFFDIHPVDELKTRTQQGRRELVTDDFFFQKTLIGHVEIQIARRFTASGL